MADNRILCQAQGMRRHLWILLPVLLAVSCVGRPAEHVIPPAVLCIPEERWPEVLAILRDYGDKNDLKFKGGVQDIATADGDARLLNVVLAQGSPTLGNEMDLWFTSRPLDPGVIDFGAIVKDTPTVAQIRLASELLSRLKAQGCIATPGDSKGRCA